VTWLRAESSSLVIPMHSRYSSAGRCLPARAHDVEKSAGHRGEIFRFLLRKKKRHLRNRLPGDCEEIECVRYTNYSTQLQCLPGACGRPNYRCMGSGSLFQEARNANTLAESADYDRHFSIIARFARGKHDCARATCRDRYGAVLITLCLWGNCSTGSAGGADLCDRREKCASRFANL